MNHEHMGRLGQIKLYTATCFHLYKNEKQWKNFISTAIITILICMVTGSEMFTDFSATRTGGFAIICACIWTGLFNSIQSICKERPIIKREHRVGMHISSYVIAHVVYELFLCAVEALIILVIVCIRNASHLPPEGLVTFMLLDVYITLLLSLFTADMLALLVSCIVTTENMAMTIMPFVLIVQLVMSGVIFSLSGLTEWISKITVSRWGLNALLSIADTDTMMNAYYIYSGLDGCDATAGNLLFNWMLLLVFALVYALIGILILERVDKDAR